MIKDMFNDIVNMLPRSPFDNVFDSIDISLFHDFMSILNWFIPIGDIIFVLELYGAAIAVYYLWSALMRFVNLIK